MELTMDQDEEGQAYQESEGREGGLFANEGRLGLTV